MLRKGWIRRSPKRASRSSKKRDGGTRTIMDCQPIEKHRTQQRNESLDADGAIQKAIIAQHVVKIDLSDAYYNIDIAPNKQTYFGVWRRMVQQHAATTFQKSMKQLIGHVYLDDLTVTAETRPGMEQKLPAIHERLEAYRSLNYTAMDHHSTDVYQG
eukprot:Protomagalhaensia_sp_Gyna_25__3502@NODE_3148_length_709_cov_2_425373_g2634_i0_p1_GENE_NODE_3148_length_709_cov_2_425373_g2634_i0NODE_3148_length_709_cov_2_425373_g2634_i0_p1_ORF_typecomplete_len157_score10_88RVT_1/PF00078_27/0_23RVT_1/PF00078_27/0_27DUF4202/PF13875_6/0_074_NODE_3148_length_709_cov_2_425373_g2634_i034504